MINTLERGARNPNPNAGSTNTYGDAGIPGSTDDGGAAGSLNPGGPDPTTQPGLTPMGAPWTDPRMPNFGYPGYEEWKQKLQGYADTAQGRQAPQAGGVTLGPAQTYQAPQMGPLQQAAAANAQAAQIGQLDPTRVAQLGSAAQVTNDPVRAQQLEAMNYQGGLMRGENSIAQQQLKMAGEDAMRQQAALAASARPGMGALAQRQAMNNQADIQQRLAGQAALAGIQERNTAAGMYGQMAGQARGQDLALGQFNVGQQNQYGLAQGQLAQSAYSQDAQQAAARAMQQAGLSQQANLANAGFQQQAGLANAQEANQRQFQQAGFNAQAGQFNAQQGNQFALTQGQMDQQTQQFNVESQLRQMGLNDAQIAQMMGLQNSANQAQQQGMVSYEQMMNQRYMQQRGIDATRELTQMQINAGKPTTWDRIMGAVAPVLTVGGGIIGGLVGGPAGAAAGAGLGGAAGSAIAGAGSGAAGPAGLTTGASPYLSTPNYIDQPMYR